MAPPPSRPETELQGVNRSLDDLTPEARAAESARPGGIIGPLAMVALAVLAMLVLAGWLLIGWPSSH